MHRWVACGLAVLCSAGCAMDGESVNNSADSGNATPEIATALPLASAEPAGAAEPGGFPKLPPGAGPIDEGAPADFSETPSGLKYRVLRAGTDEMAKASSSVEVNYHGWLDNGKVFDSSYKRGESISFPLNGVIPGWTEGMQLVGKGGMIELEIPGRLGYGPSGAPPDIPPNATLHFLVELIDIN